MTATVEELLAQRAECSSSSCRRPIVWTTTAGRRAPMPIDPEPAHNGNIELHVETIPAGIDEEYGEPYPARDILIATYVDPAQGDLFGRPDRYISHFATCPDAGTFRKA